MVTARRTPFGAGGNIARDDLAVPILGHERVGDELSVTRNLRRLNRVPRIIVLMPKWSFGSGLLLAKAVGKRRSQQSHRANQTRTLSGDPDAAFHSDTSLVTNCFFKPRLDRCVVSLNIDRI